MDLTGKDGSGLLLPIFVEGDSSTFRVVAFAPGYCVFVSDPVTFSLTTETVPLVELRLCSGDVSVLGLKAQPDEDLVVMAEEVGVKNEEVVYTNKRNIDLRLDAHSVHLRGIQVSVYEGWQPSENQAVLTQKTVSRFESLVEVELPAIFPSTQSETGLFRIELTPIGLESDQSDLIEKAIVYGRKSLERPSLAYTLDLKVLSSEGFDGVISGDSGNFQVTSESCLDEQSLGVDVGNVCVFIFQHGLEVGNRRFNGLLVGVFDLVAMFRQAFFRGVDDAVCLVAGVDGFTLGLVG